MVEAFGWSTPLWQIVLRATVVYVALVLLLRIVAKRNVGNISPNDILTLVIVGGMGTDAIMGRSTSVGDILLFIAVVVFWAYVLDSLEYHVPAVRCLLRDRNTILVENGRMIRRNMRQELVTEEELMAELRKEGSRIWRW
jgi:uncharacterized membrane protein YcaP (DUF421 family)